MNKVTVALFFGIASLFTNTFSYDVFVIKLGGGAITAKNEKRGKEKIDIISTIAQEIASFLSKNPNARLIIINGGGSFAHPIAKKYKLNLDINKEKINGVIKCHIGTTEINNIVVNALIDQGMQALPVDPMSCIQCTNGIMSSMNIEVIKTMLAHDIVPVLHGDIVIDKAKRMSILSGDQIASFLGKQLNAKGVGYASVEDGVYDKFGKVIPEINKENFNQIRQFIGGSAHTDVTGGMLGKVAELLTPNAPKCSYIFNGTVKGNILKFLNGATLGTKIVNQ
ncbi:isopentenyl phosphate kinase [Candidatus Dependentiae bacterium]